MAIVPVEAVLRRVADANIFGEDRLLRIASALKGAGLSSSREFRLGFPPSVQARQAEARGLAIEIAADLLNERPDELEVLIYAAIESCAHLSVGTCFSVIATGGIPERRLSSGTYVERESAAASAGSTSRPSPSVATSVAGLPKGRFSFGVSVEPTGFTNANARRAVSAAAASLSDGRSKKPRVEAAVTQTLQKKEKAKLLRAQGELLELLSRVGSLSAAWCELFGEDPSRDLEAHEAEVLFGILMGRTQPKAILDYCREVNAYLSWVEGIGRAPHGVGPLMLCSFFRMALSRGKSVPLKIKCALVWFESHAKIQLNATGVEVRDYVSGLTVRDASGLHKVEAARQAPPLPVDTVIRLERLATTAHTLPFRVFAGVICLCVHGVKRWSDVQHVLSMSALADGLLVKTYKSKEKKDFPILWGALREGFGCDWASSFVAALAEANLPRGDFMVP